MLHKRRWDAEREEDEKLLHCGNWIMTCQTEAEERGEGKQPDDGAVVNKKKGTGRVISFTASFEEREKFTASRVLLLRHFQKG